jgi:hypothetical protein
MGNQPRRAAQSQWSTKNGAAFLSRAVRFGPPFKLLNAQ